MNKDITGKIYARAIKTDYKLEKIIMDKNGMSTKFPFVIPKSVKLMGIIKNKNIWTAFFYILSILWWIIIFPIYSIYEFLKTMISKSIVKFHSKNIDGNVILGLSPRIYDLENRIDISVDYRIDFPWINKSEITKDRKSIDFMSLVNYKDIFIALKRTFKFSKKSIQDNYDITARLLTYSAFKWFLVYEVLENRLKDCKTLYFCNQYDRWIHLLDNIDISGEKIIIQHGVVMPFKVEGISRISKIYCFNENQMDIFKNDIFIDCDDLKFDRIPLSINLSEVEYKNSLLIIGQPFSANKEIEIINELLKRELEIKIYIKPHPRFGDSIYSSIKDKVEIIDNPKFYPKVDLALSYESTLGLEYEASGVNVIWIKNKKASRIVENVLSLFE